CVGGGGGNGQAGFAREWCPEVCEGGRQEEDHVDERDDLNAGLAARTRGDAGGEGHVLSKKEEVRGDAGAQMPRGQLLGPFFLRMSSRALAASEMWWRASSTRVLRRLKGSRPMMAMARPQAVAMRASPTPPVIWPALAAMSPVPSAPKVFIMPMTVPSRPSRGAAVMQVSMMARPCWKRLSSWLAARVKALARERSLCVRAQARMRAT